jgi:hypothetical protein
MNRKPWEVIEDTAKNVGLLSTTTAVFTRRRPMDSRRAFRVPRVSLRWARIPRERTTRSAWSARTRPRRDVRCRFPVATSR